MVNPLSYEVTFIVRAFPAGGREGVPVTQKELREYADLAVKSWVESVPQMAIPYDHEEDVTFIIRKAKIKGLYKKPKDL